ncbi:hypothetical protein FJZ26_05380 [Candidatus Parvarchaeota archaeon]|nr:hypothetical protein [Candidatus Parvarchaeota archaeon]
MKKPNSSKKSIKKSKPAQKKPKLAKRAQKKAMPKKKPHSAQPRKRASGMHVVSSKANMPRMVKQIEAKDVSSSVRESIDQLKGSLQPHYTYVETEVEVPKAPVILDKVYLQRISFEISGIRQALERMNKQLDKLEDELQALSD